MGLYENLAKICETGLKAMGYLKNYTTPPAAWKAESLEITKKQKSRRKM